MEAERLRAARDACVRCLKHSQDNAFKVLRAFKCRRLDEDWPIFWEAVDLASHSVESEVSLCKAVFTDDVRELIEDVVRQQFRLSPITVGSNVEYSYHAAAVLNASLIQDVLGESLRLLDDKTEAGELILALKELWVDLGVFEDSIYREGRETLRHLQQCGKLEVPGDGRTWQQRRNDYFLQLRDTHTEINSPAKIRDHWNSLSDDERFQITGHRNTDIDEENNDNGRGLVKNGIEDARKRREKTARK